MNSERFAGFCLEVAGSINQAWGVLTGNQARESSGRRDRILGKARQATGAEQEASARQLKEFRHYHRNWNL